MIPSDDLFLLIQSLSKAEKRYFKLFTGMGAGRAHVHPETLFDTIAGMESWDEEMLKGRLKDKRILDHLPLIKNRLQDLILRSLRVLREGESVDSQLNSLLLDIEILFEKQMYKPARKKIRKAAGLAKHFEKEAHLLQLLAWEHRFFVLQPDEEEKEFYHRNEQEEKECIRRMEKQRSLTRLYEQLRSLIRKGENPRQGSGVESYHKIISHPDLNEPPPSGEFTSFALFLAIKGIYAYAQGKLTVFRQEFQRLMEFWHAHEDRIPDQADFYLGSFGNYATACLSDITHSPDFFDAVKRIRSLTGLPVALKLKFERVTYTHEIGLRTNFGIFEENLAFIEELSIWLKKNETRLEAPRLLFFYLNITLYFFSASEFSMAQKWLWKIVNFPATEARADIRDFARIFQLVLQYELGNLDVQDYMLRSAYRYFFRTDKLHDFEDALIHFMKREQKNAGIDPELTRKELETLHVKWLSVMENHSGSHPVGLQVLIFWVESKLENVSMKSYYTRKVKERENKEGGGN